MPTHRAVALRTKLAFALVVLLLVGVALELTVRIAFAAKIGPRVLLYGIVSDRDEQGVQSHENVVAGRYSKYFPHQKRRDADVDTGESFEVTINAHGFRGEDWSVAKPPGVVRVVTLGASSTFGYHDRDDETYPHYLERDLAEACPARRFEVINLGIPHLDAEQILALFVDEALALDPDVVTFYEGINDAQGGGWRAPTAPSLASRVRRAVREHLLLAALLADLRAKKSFTADEVAAHVGGKAERFLASLAQIREQSRERGIELAVVTQQAQSGMKTREEMRGLRYGEEVARIRERLASQGEIASGELYLLAHDELMRALRGWSAANGVTLVDGIAALDARRDTMVSWVHLNAEGNRILSRAIASALLPRVCPGAPPPAAGVDSAAAPSR
ncbi:MAG: hypothetical protein DCC71_15105 [Proteobacteria bacterium]|nr:MAG: hypothetical protein DCC71_15105 [Pseudomonadota bacterium]